MKYINLVKGFTSDDSLIALYEDERKNWEAYDMQGLLWLRDEAHIEPIEKKELQRGIDALIARGYA